MQWKQIKTLFILCFLLLDVYLLVLFFDKQDDADDFTMSNPSLPTIDKRLEEENITISTDLPEQELEESYISVQQKLFTTEEQEELADKENQKSAIIDRGLIVSKFDSPIPVPADASGESISSILKSNFLLEENYQYWNWNKELNVLIFFQKKSDRQIYYNQNGIILVFLNDDNEAIFYTQSMLGETETPGSSQSLIIPMHAIKSLFEENKLHSGDDITNVDLGFYTFIPLTSGEQVFAPTWAITINDKKNYYVNAIENLVFSSDEAEFLTNTATSIMSKAQEIEDKKLKQFILEHLSQTLSSINRSEIE